MKLKRVILLLVVIATLCCPTVKAAAGWEDVSRMPQRVERVEGEDVEIATRDSYVYINVNRSTHIKIFTILGQPISQSTLAPGAYRFKLSAKGIYIIKIGSITRRVTI